MKKSVFSLSILIVCVMLTSLLLGCSLPATPVAQDATKPAAAPADSSPTTASLAEKPAQQNSAGPFDKYPLPKVKADGKLTVCYVHTVPSAESQSRSVHQSEIEVAHRGWKVVDITYPDPSKLRDALLNCLNQDIDALLFGNTQSMESYQDIVDKARNANIGVYNNDNQIIPGVIANSTMPNGLAAMELIYAIGNKHYWTDSIGFMDIPFIQVSNERIQPIKALMSAYPNMKALESQDASVNPAGPVMAGYETARTWLEKYGKDITGMIGFADLLSTAAAEAIIAAGDPHGEKTWTAGIDGGSQAFGYIRDNTPFQFDYAQPFELYTHKIFELMDQIQVKGMRPGDKDCLIKFSGDTMYSTGTVVTRENVPPVGADIHSVFHYYGGESVDKNAWYNWSEAGGPLKIQAGSRQEIPQK